MREMLGSPCRINELAIRNRVVFEAVGNGLSELNGDVSQKEIAFYTERAKGGVGLIMTEAVPMDSVTRRAKPRDLCIDRGDQIAGYQALADAVHGRGQGLVLAGEGLRPGQDDAVDHDEGDEHAQALRDIREKGLEQ